MIIYLLVALLPIALIAACYYIASDLSAMKKDVRSDLISLRHDFNHLWSTFCQSNASSDLELIESGSIYFRNSLDFPFIGGLVSCPVRISGSFLPEIDHYGPSFHSKQGTPREVIDSFGIGIMNQPSHNISFTKEDVDMESINGLDDEGYAFFCFVIYSDNRLPVALFYVALFRD